MKSKRTYLIALLVLSLAGAGYVIWQQQDELASLRTKTAATKDTGADKKLWDAEQRVRQLEADLAASRAAAANAPRGDTRGPQTAAQNPQAAIQGLMQMFTSGNMQQAMSTQMKAQIDSQYAALVRILGLGPADADKLKSTLMERNTASQDALTSALAAGLNPGSPEFRDFLKQATDTSTNNLRAQLGEAGYASLQSYEATQGQRNTVNTLQQQLVQQGASALLSDAQAEQLVQVLANGQPANNNARQQALAAMGGAAAFGGVAGGLGGAAAFMGGGAQPLSESTLAQAQQILTPQQFQGLQQMQQTQQAQQAMVQQMTQAIGGAGFAIPGQGGGGQARGQRGGGGSRGGN